MLRKQKGIGLNSCNVQIHRTIRCIFLLAGLLLLVGLHTSYAFVKPPVSEAPRTGIKLIENKGQWDSAVLFKANIPGGDMYLTRTGIVYQLIDEGALHDANHKGIENPLIKGHNYKMTFSNGQPVTAVSTTKPSTETYNYFIGDDTASWASGCRAFETVTLHNIYEGIDAEIVAHFDFIKLNFIVHPFANPHQINLVYEGMNQLQVKNGALMIYTSVATVKEDKPIAFQGSQQIVCNYTLQKQQLQFVLGAYNPNQTLVIDPEIIFATYSGSVADNFGYTATYDEAGNGYAGGTVFSSGFPTTMGAFQRNFAGGTGSARDMGILKFSADGTTLLYATYLGGRSNEQPHSLICNAAGELYIMGTTQSNNFPTSATAFDRIYNGGYDIVISKLSVDGTQLLASTYWGGTDNDGLNGNPASGSYNISNPLTYNYGDFYRGEIMLSPGGQVYIASSTQSSPTEGYPLFSAFQNIFGGGSHDGIVFSLNSTLTAVGFSTYIGGSSVDALYGLRFDSQNNLIVCGGTKSSDLPASSAFPYRGDVDGFIAKINTTTLSLQKLVYLGTSAYDQTYFIDLDPSDRIYVTGQSLGNFPTKGSVYQNANSSQFISILNSGMDSLMYSTTIGSGSGDINFSPSAFMVDRCGKVYLSGWGGSSNGQFNGDVGNTWGLDVTPDAFQTTTDGSDFYLIILSENLASLTYATFLGGRFSADHVDGGTSRFDKQGMVYQSICAGCGGYSDLPVTPGCYSSTNNGIRPDGSSDGCNNALIKFSADPNEYLPLVKDTLLTVIATDTLFYNFTVSNPIGDSIILNFSGAVLTLPNAPLITPGINGNIANVSLRWFTRCENTSPDTFEISVEAKANGCFDFRTEMATIKILVLPPPAIIPPYPNCLKTIDDSTIRISWTQTAYGRYFKKLEVYKSVAGGAFTALAQTFNETDTVFWDYRAQNHLTSNICYYFVGTNICDSVSVIPSRFVCSLYPFDSSAHHFEAPYDDTLVYITATDTLDYTFFAGTVNPEDSIFITTTGNLFQTNRVLSTQYQPALQNTSYRLRWRSLCSDIALPDTLFVQFFIRDNQCPQSRTKISRLKIVVNPPPLYDPPAMRCTRNISQNGVLVRWAPTNIPNPRYFSHYVLLRKNADGTFTQLMEVSSDSAFSYTDNDAPNNETNNICYGAYGVNICNHIGDTSEFSCTVVKTINQPDPLYIYTTTVVDNSFIQVQWAKSDNNDFLKYQVFKKDAVNGYILIHESGNINDTTTNDKATDVHHNVYCYEIKQMNDCGAVNEDAYRSCSILLTGESNPFKHNLNWNDYDFWTNGVNRYSVNRQQPDMPQEEIDRLPYKNTTKEDNQLNTDNGLYHYTIVGRERNTSITSTSNTIELIQAPLLHASNAFTANDDGLNDTWQPVPVFVKEYNLKVYNRWGQLVFETNNKKEPFKGIMDGVPATCDVFVYLITYTGWDGSSHQVKGNVTQLK